MVPDDEPRGLLDRLFPRKANPSETSSGMAPAAGDTVSSGPRDPVTFQRIAPRMPPAESATDASFTRPREVEPRAGSAAEWMMQHPTIAEPGPGEPREPRRRRPTRAATKGRARTVKGASRTRMKRKHRAKAKARSTRKSTRKNGGRKQGGGRKKR